MNREKKGRLVRQGKGIVKTRRLKFTLEDLAELREGHWENLVIMWGTELSVKAVRRRTCRSEEARQALGVGSISRA